MAVVRAVRAAAGREGGEGGGSGGSWDYVNETYCGCEVTSKRDAGWRSVMARMVLGTRTWTTRLLVHPIEKTVVDAMCGEMEKLVGATPRETWAVMALRTGSRLSAT